MNLDGKNHPAKGLIFDLSLKGHRPSYFEVFRKELGFETAWGSIFENLRHLISTPRLFCLTIDDYLVPFSCVALLRSLLGRPTMGLSLRIENMFQHLTLRRRVKRALYQILLRAPKVSVCSLKPFFLEPRLSEVAQTWVYDPQWWDLLVSPIIFEKPSFEMQLHYEEAAAFGKPIIVLPGHQSLIKGLEIFTKFAEKNPQYTCVCLGPNKDIPETFWNAFKKVGGLPILMELTEEDLAWLYHHADAIWACYRSDYDQSSGIFGRALQRGKKVAVREGSFLHEFVAAAGIQNVVVVDEEGNSRAPQIPNIRAQDFSPEIARTFSLAQVREHLHLPKIALDPRSGDLL